ncbi:hypothetical protein V8G54_010307 [Vigna mungo]|uniref:Uncharacterized protein n=1 Tax=Vigna mungo TaxID=3915 RepID=A0AAQ3NW94_VIGMU
MLPVVYAVWVDVRARYMSPPLQSLANLCTVLFIVQSVDRVVLILGCFWIKFRRLKPVASVDYDAVGISAEDFPMVLVQIPMFTSNPLEQFVSWIGQRRECSFRFLMILMK